MFADDWGRHPSSCQHLVRHLLATRPVAWVNTIGTRPPRLDWSTARRVAGKLRSWTRPAPPAPANVEAAPRVLSPKMWPSFASGRSRRLNRVLLERALRPVFEAMPEPPVVLTTLPLVADLVGRLPAARWVYYCVDDFAEWPGYDGATLQRLERELVPKVDALVAVSEHLQGHLKRLGRESHLLTHGVDLERWRVTEGAGEVPEFAGLDPPFVLFWGVIDRRLDLAFVRRLAETLTVGTLVFVGPREDPDPALAALPRVALRPAVAFGRLPALAIAAQVLVMPYLNAPVTRAMQPLKMKEYLATGRPCVVRDLPATRPWADALDVAGSPEAFAAKVLERLAGGLPESQRGPRRRLEAEGWGAKARELAGWLAG